MIHSLKERVWTYVSATFPERQIYIRSDGRVQFFTFSPMMQAVLAGISLLFLGWVAFTSVNVIFKDRILAAKERRFEQAVSSYESRIADLQLSYDELNGTLLQTEDQFKTVADSFEAKQQVLKDIIEHKRSLDAALSPTAPTRSGIAGASPVAPAGMGGVLEPLVPNEAAQFAPPFATGLGNAAEPSSVASPQPAPQQHSALVPAYPAHITFIKGAVQRLGSLFHRKTPVTVDHPVLAEARAQELRIAKLDIGTPALLAEAHQDVDKDVVRLSKAVAEAGIPKTLITRVASESATGGPNIAINPADLGIEDENFGAEFSATMASMKKLGQVVGVLKAVPLVAPVGNPSVSSGFGARVDPFNENLAFHTGIDFSGPLGSDVRATAGGIVVFAGKNGAYGNSVEIDHGYGIRTRYGHLAKVLVQEGAHLDKGAIIGRLGSTGRSTGPHVHYEVWYDDAVRDPGKLIKAGQHVLEE